MAVPSTTSLDVATTTVGAIPLTTSFAGEPGCKANHLTMIGLLQDEVWLNEPFPASGLTSSECYPTEMLASITATTSMPAFSPLICPDWYTTATRWSQNYIACCPSSYTLALSTGPTPAARSAFNATCYSNLVSLTSVTAYDTVGVTSTQGYNDPTAQAYAHAIDGYAPVTAGGSTLTVATGPGPLITPGPSVASRSLTPLTGSPDAGAAAATAGPSTAEPTSRSTSSGLPPAAIAGIVVAGFAFCLLSALLIWIALLLRRRKRDTMFGPALHKQLPSYSSPRPDPMTERSNCSSHKEANVTGAIEAPSPSDVVTPITPRSPWGAGAPDDRDQPPVPPNLLNVRKQSGPAEVGEGLPFEIGEGVQQHELMEGDWREKTPRRPTRAVAELEGEGKL